VPVNEKAEPNLPSDPFLKAFTECQPALMGFCAASIGNHEDSRDVFQKVCLVLWKKFGEWNPEIPFQRWAFAVARFEVLAYVRDKGRERVLFDSDVAQAMAGTCQPLLEPQFERAEAMEHCLSKLAPKHREALTAHYVNGYNLKEIAAFQKKSLSAVKVSMMRLRRSLSECIENRLMTST